MSKHVGIVACSSEGAALCYRTLCLEAAREMGEYFHPEVTMHTHSLGEYMRFVRAGDWEGVAHLMLSSAEKLARAGAQFLICPDNTIHQAFDLVLARSPLPFLHIVDAVAEQAARQGHRCLGILGTRFLMEGPVYSQRLGPLGFAHRIPEPEERGLINAIIFNELVNGQLKDESRAAIVAVISRLIERGCDAIVLGCTEIPLLITPADSPLPTLDSTRLLARAALRTALSP